MNGAAVDLKTWYRTVEERLERVAMEFHGPDGTHCSLDINKKRGIHGELGSVEVRMVLKPPAVGQ